MKKIVIIGSAFIFLLGCNDAATTKTGPVIVSDSTIAKDSSAAEQIDYAFLPAKHVPDFWDRGDQKKVAMVLKSFRAFTHDSVDESMKAFADSVYLSNDNYEGKFSKDSLRTLFTGEWKTIKSVKIDMDDYEAVIGKDKKTEFVTLWYKEIITDKKGKMDSAYFVDDLKIENNKIASLDEKSRKVPKKKK